MCVCLCTEQNCIYKIQYNQHRRRRRRRRLISTAAINKISTGEQAGTRESKVAAKSVADKCERDAKCDNEKSTTRIKRSVEYKAEQLDYRGSGER